MEKSLDTKGKTPILKVPYETMPPKPLTEDQTNVTSTSNDRLKPSSVEWSVGELMMKFGGDMQENPFCALVDLNPHNQVDGASSHTTLNMTELMLYYQLCVRVFTYEF
jgi:hypothetical protein